ncbi:hypothetical protein GCM10027610_027010 [Dactylosporangium cerinum]
MRELVGRDGDRGHRAPAAGARLDHHRPDQGQEVLDQLPWVGGGQLLQPGPDLAAVERRGLGDELGLAAGKVVVDRARAAPLSARISVNDMPATPLRRSAVTAASTIRPRVSFGTGGSP